jgi:hypothetical protein
MQVATNGRSPASPGPWVDCVPKALRAEIADAFESEGLMQQSVEDRIMNALGKNHAEMREDIRGVEARVQDDIRGLRTSMTDILTQFNGTNGTPGVFTRIKLLEEHTGKSATLWRHAKAAIITAIVTAAVTFVLGRVLLPSWSADAEQIRALQQQLKEAEQKIEAQAAATDDEPEPVQPARPAKRTNKPRRSPAPPLGPGQSRNQDVWADQSSRFYGSAQLASLPEIRNF